MRAILLFTLLVAGCESGRGVAANPADLAVPSRAAVLAHTCAMVISCPLWPPESMSSCVEELEQGLAAFGPSLFSPAVGTAAQLQLVIDCAGAASDCAGARACVSRNHDADYCLGAYGNSCDGDLVIACGPTGSAFLATDCGALGEHCGAGTGTPGNTASCTNGVACQPGGPDACDGNRFIQCDADTRLESSIDCTTLQAGATCGSYMGFFSTCMPAGPACSGVGPQPLRCDGTSLVICVEGHELAFDCTAFEAHCVDSGFSSACVSDASDCAAGTEQCSGDSLQICVDGHLETIDCTSIGLRTCVETPAVVADMGGSSGSVKCVP